MLGLGANICTGEFKSFILRPAPNRTNQRHLSSTLKPTRLPIRRRKKWNETVPLDTGVEAFYSPISNLSKPVAGGGRPRSKKTENLLSQKSSQRPRNSQRVPDREEPAKPRKDARRGRCHPLETGFRPLWMTPLPRNYAAQAQAQAPSEPESNLKFAL
jgi:hypothetical protein